MKILSLLVVAGGLTAAGLASPAQAGCLTGAAIGGVAGHVVGHHGLLGAAAGCAIGHHRSAESRRDNAGYGYGDRGYDRGGYQNQGYRAGPDQRMYGRDAYRDDQAPMPR